MRKKIVLGLVLGNGTDCFVIYLWVTSAHVTRFTLLGRRRQNKDLWLGFL